MALSKDLISSVEFIIKKSLLDKLSKYNPEPAHKPFHSSLLGKDRLALYAFIHSLNTSFGTTIFKPLAVSLAEGRFKEAKRQTCLGDRVSIQAQSEIQKIMDGLASADPKPDKQRETEMIPKVC